MFAESVRGTLKQLFLAAFCVITASAQTSNQPTAEGMQKRLLQIIAEMKAIREELGKLK